MRIQKGITLIPLVITIILLLILAGVSIRTLGGENGLIERTKIAKEENKKSEYKDYLSIAKTEAIAEKGGQDITLDEYIEQIKADKIEGIKNIEKITNDKASVITKEGYIFIITVDSIKYYENENNLPEMNIKDANIEFTFNPNTWTNKKVEVTVGKKENKYTLQLSKDITKWTTTNKMTFEENGEIYARLIDEIGRTSDVASRKIIKIDKEKPVVTEVTPSTNSVRIKATDNAAGIIGYAVTTTNTEPTEFTECESTTELDTTVENLKQGTTYYAWVKDAAGNVSASKSTATGNVTGLTIKPNTANWSTSKTITITATNSNYSNIRYTTDGTIPTSTTGTAISSGGTFTITSNCTIVAVAFDSTGQAGSTVTNKVTTIDRGEPGNASIKLSTTSILVGNTISATVTHNDSQSGPNILKCKWIYNTSSSAIGNDSSKYSNTFSSNSQIITFKPTTLGIYYLHVLTTDNAGNAKETISNAIHVGGIPAGTTIATSTASPNGYGEKSTNLIDGNLNNAFNFMSYSGTATLKFKTTQQISKVVIYHVEDSYSWNYKILSGSTVIGKAENVSGLTGSNGKRIRTINVTPGKYNQISIYVESIGNKWWLSLIEIYIYP